MTVRGNRRRWHRLRLLRIILPSIVLSVASLAIAPRLRAQGPGGDVPSPRLTRPSIRPILVDVEFEGNETVSDDELQASIQTRPTHTPLIKRYFALLADFLELNILAPHSRVQNGALIAEGPRYEALRKMIDSLGGEIRYLNIPIVEADTNRIKALYDQYGFHDAQVDYSIRLDTVRNTSIVHFAIKENTRYPLRDLKFMGLENIPADLRAQLVDLQIVKRGDPFSAEKVQAETDRVLDGLHNNGYAFAASTSESPLVLIAHAYDRDTLPGAPYDSVLAFIYTGNRYRVGETSYQPDTLLECTVSEPLVLAQREYAPGDYYNKERLDQTVANLYALQTFDLVTIDTNRALSSDSALGLRISTRMRAQNDLRVAPEMSWERRVSEYVTNLGLSSTYSRLNAFCTQGHLTVTGRIQAPTKNLLTKYPLNEAQGGLAVSYFMPSMPWITFIPQPQRLSLLTSASYDNTVVDRLRDTATPPRYDVTLRSQTWGGVGEFSYRFPRYTFLNLFSLRLTYQHNTYFRIGEYLTHLAERRVDTTKGIDVSCDLDSVRKAVYDALVDNVYHVQVLQGDDPNLIPPTETKAREHFSALKSTIALSAVGVGDHRNDYFSPTDGDLGEIRAEFGSTGFTGGYGKLEIHYRSFNPLGAWTWAWRAHVGYIQEFGAVPLTPVSSRFSAGGASSLRGWEAREMLATRPPELDGTTVQSCAQPIVQQIVDENRRLLGGLALLELSAELRTRIFNLTGNSTLAQQLNELVFIGFADAGNAYFRDQEDVRRATWKFFYTNIGLDVGASVGYNTPVGPFRIGAGLPIYDPTIPESDMRHRWFWTRPFVHTLVWHVGIGHAF